MPEQNEYFDKYLDARFKHIDDSMQNISNAVKDLKEDNKTTRRWIFGTVVGTGITVLLGLATILFTLIQVQNSWMQQIFSFVGKSIIK